jgi:hypothetical protein
MSPHEPEKRPRLEQLANTGSLRWLRPAGGAISDRARDGAASIAPMDGCCATSRYPRISIAPTARAEVSMAKWKSPLVAN